MEISSIISLLKEYIMLAVVLLTFLGVLFFIGYKVIYRKLMNGKKTINKKRLGLYSISVVYIIVVLGAVFLNRTGLYGNTNLHLFSSYREAYNKMEISLFRNIVLNILLFVPLGFLLPIYSNKLKKSYIVISIGFLVTLAIETIQYLTRVGIFEIDDIFNNTIGTLIGYLLFMIYKNIMKKQNRKYIAIYALPILLVITFFALIYIKYEIQELGNLPIEYNYKVNMKNINIEKQTEYSKDRTNQDIFYKKTLTEEETRRIAEKIFENMGTTLDKSRIDIYENTAVYYSNSKEESGYSVWIDYKGGTYSYTDFSNFSYDDKKEIKVKAGSSREEIEKALEKIGVKVPENATFKEEKDGNYAFSIDMELQGEKLIDGNLACVYYEDNTVKRITNNIIEYKKVASKEIISEEEAYNKILEGKFKYDEYNIGIKIKDISFGDVKLSYLLDSKGYYVPIYIFSANMNGRNTEIKIRAVE